MKNLDNNIASCHMESPLAKIKLSDLAYALRRKLATVSRVVNGSRLSIPIGQEIADYLGQPLENIFPAIHEKKLRREQRNQKKARPKPEYDTSDLRKACKHLMIDLDLDRPGAYGVILPRLSEKMGKRLNINALIMALSGNRQGPSYQLLLGNLQDLLKNWPQKAA